MLNWSSDNLQKKYDWLSVEPILADYTKEVKWKVVIVDEAVYFLGGIGNFDANLALQFLKKLKNNMGLDDYLLIGADRVKRPDLLCRL